MPGPSTTSESQPLRIFLCHASQDKPAVRELYQRLKVDGFEPWLDEQNLLPGHDWQREIPRAVQNSDIVLVCLSHRSINKDGYVQKEIRIVLDIADEKPEDAIFVIPARLEDCDVPQRLSRWQWVNIYESSGYRRLRLALAERAKQLAVKEDVAKRLPDGTHLVVRPYVPVRTVKVIIARSGDGQIDAQRVGEVHQAMSACPGPDKFCFIIMARGSFYQMDFPNDSTTLNDELITYLKSMPGVESVQVSFPYDQGQS